VNLLSFSSTIKFNLAYFTCKYQYSLSFTPIDIALLLNWLSFNYQHRNVASDL